MVLCAQDGQSRMDMIVNVDANTDIISRDIWSECDFKGDKTKCDKLSSSA